MKVAIRADGNHYVGLGHIMRCLSIADAFDAHSDISVIFILSDEAVKDIVISRGYECVILNTNYKDLESELSVWESLGLCSYDLVIVDSYFVTHSFFYDLKDTIRKNGGRVVYNDDVMSFPYPVDILINYNVPLHS